MLFIAPFNQIFVIAFVSCFSLAIHCIPWWRWCCTCYSLHHSDFLHRHRKSLSSVGFNDLLFIASFRTPPPSSQTASGSVVARLLLIASSRLPPPQRVSDRIDDHAGPCYSLHLSDFLHRPPPPETASGICSACYSLHLSDFLHQRHDHNHRAQAETLAIHCIFQTSSTSDTA